MRRMEDIGEEEVRNAVIMFRKEMGKLMSRHGGNVAPGEHSAVLDRVIGHFWGEREVDLSRGAYYQLRLRIMKEYRGPIQRGFGFGSLPKRDRIVIAPESGSVPPPPLRTREEALDKMERDAMEEYCRRLAIGRSERRALRIAISIATASSAERIASGEYGVVLAELERRMAKRPRTGHDAAKWLKQGAPSG